VPFGYQSSLPEARTAQSEWSVDGWQQISSDVWRLTAHAPCGLHATWNVQVFPQTRALECWGEITHQGSEPVRHIIETHTVDCIFDTKTCGEPYARSVNGVRFVPSSFPPHDFAHVDRQLLHVPQVHPFALAGTPDGRTSGENMPVLMWGDEREQHGLAAFLEWSGLWHLRLSLMPEDRLKFQAGLDGLDLHLHPGQSLPLARLLLTGFEGNLDAGGNALRRHIRRFVMPQLGGREVIPPTSFNHWFAFENNFSAASFRPAVQAAAAAGLEYFCVDGGWFLGGFRSGIGNWSEGDPEKFPNGIAPFADYVRECGMQYGTWFEPEWAHKDSEIFRAHPDWFWLSPPSYLPWQSEFHLMNFGMHEVQEWWLQRFIEAYEKWGMRWVRWDFNGTPRPNWEHDVPVGEIGWRQIEHVQGLYRTLDRIMEACPDLLIEQCAMGGHRIELGTVRRGHTFWMNDHTSHTDIVRALQQGLNFVLPGNYPNTNLCQPRHDFDDYDFLSHGCGPFGYSGKLWEAPPADFERFKEFVTRFKSYRHLLLGDYARPTGQPRRADEYSQVLFYEGDQCLTLQWNRTPRVASLQFDRTL
jgi:alpha-galactosidase